mmetsp:Transcript_10855/g.17681  ORF Transcript_10855/g.17681 Transcript_10855/m.17681 type:complete len:255 (+) Transcript_10855:111-875(+)
MTQVREKKTVKFLDSSLISNDVLRPWTINIDLEKRLQEESSAFDKILTFTTPQKFAGTLGSSDIDHVPDEFREYQPMLELNVTKKLQETLSRTTKNRRLDPKSPATSSSRVSSHRESGSGRISRANTPSSRGGHSGDGSGNGSRRSSRGSYDDPDIEYIERLKRSMYVKTMKAQKSRAQTAYHNEYRPIQGIRYSEYPFGPVSPTKSKLILTPFHAPKPAQPNMGGKIKLPRNIEKLPGISGSRLRLSNSRAEL